MAGNVPKKFISDGAANFGEARKYLYAPKNYLWPDSEHISYIHMDGNMNNNQMESFNGNTVRQRERPCAESKRMIQPFQGMQIHHNFVRSHRGMDGDTPADRASSSVLGDNKWKAIIQNAAKNTKK